MPLVRLGKSRYLVGGCEDAQTAGTQDSTATKDAVVMTVGLVVFWPSLFFLSGGDGANAAELARLKGSMDALEQAGIRKNCGI